MAQAVRAGGLEHAGFQPSFFKRALQNRFMEVMPALFSSNRIGEMTGCRKNPLPATVCLSLFALFLRGDSFSGSRVGHLLPFAN